MKYEEAKAKYENILASGISIADVADDDVLIVSMFKLESKINALNIKRKAMRGIPAEEKLRIKAIRNAYRKAQVELLNASCVQLVKDELALLKTDNSTEKAELDEERKIVRGKLRRAMKSLEIEVVEDEPVDEDVEELLNDAEETKTTE
jgi:hypothetical protein